AITDFTGLGTLSGGVYPGETFVDGYGAPTSLLTINGFTFGSSGDSINFAVADWAYSGTAGTGPQGLVESDGQTFVTAGFATYVQEGTAHTALTFLADI